MHLYPAAWRARYGVEFQSLLEDMKPGFLDIVDILRGGLQMRFAHSNFWKMGAVFALAGTLAGVVVLSALPAIFISTAVLRLDSGDVGELARGAFSRRGLYEIIQREKLYEGLRAEMPAENIVERMRRDIRIQKTKGNAFEIAFASSDPAKA